jgi:uncharacterized membrane protein YfcA
VRDPDLKAGVAGSTERGAAGAAGARGGGAGGRAGTAKVMVAGLIAGFLSGLFGVGGGILLVPALVILLGMGQRLAHGTSLAAIVPIA